MLSEEQTIRKHSSVQLKSEVKVKIKSRGEDSGEQQCCDFCGVELSAVGLGGVERRKYCSKSCQSRASQRRIKARLAMPPSKRYAATLKFSDPLYFN